MDSEALALDEVLETGKENVNVAVWNDIGIQEFILKEDMAVVMVVTTPVVKGFCDTVSITSSRRAWGRRSIDLWRCHFVVNGSRDVLPMWVEIAKHDRVAVKYNHV